MRTVRIRVQLADVTEASQVDRMVSEIVEAFGHIDVLVNSAGIILNGNIQTTKEDDWDKMMDVNLCRPRNSRQCSKSGSCGDEYPHTRRYGRGCVQ